MDKLIIVTFDNERKAYEGSKALRELDAEGGIALYALAVIAKDATGKLTLVQAADEGPLGTAVGLVTGSLFGLLGGPVGVMLGASVGMFGGMLSDLAYVGVGEDFLNEAGQSLEPGKVAVVAEIWEDWVTPLDSRMEAMGGVVLRSSRTEFIDAEIERDAAALKAEVASLKAEAAQATGAAKAKLEAQIDAVNARLQTTQERAKKALETANQERAAKIQSLKEQIAKAQGEAKAKREARLAKMEAEYKLRTDKLKQAWTLTKEALAA
jgi:uncharacterized membrane protein